MSIELIRIIDSSSGSPTGTAFGRMLVLHVKSPRSSTSVTVRLDWGVLEGATGPAAESEDLFFDLPDSSAHTVQRANQSYKITLMQIGSDASGRPWYEFQITTQA